MIKIAPSVVLLGLLLFAGSADASQTDKRFQANGWLLQIHLDRFTARSRCVLASANHRLRYQPGAIGFLLGKRRDTLGAWYKVDGGVPVRWQNRTAALVASGVAIDGPGLDNPTGGWVWIPVSEVDQATSVAIRGDDKGRVHRFRVSGFEAMLDASRRLGCESDDTFRA